MNGLELALLDRAAACYEQAREHVEAARLRERTGALAAAARLYESGGDLVNAAACYRRARQPGEAARCHLLLGQVPEAAACVERAGDALTAAWLLASAGRLAQRARWTMAGVRTVTLDERLRGDLVTGLCDALETGDGANLAAAVAAVCGRLAGASPAERERLVRWAVRAADAVGRRDLAAQAHAAAYLAGVPGARKRWQDWAEHALGGTAWIPAADTIAGAAAPDPTRTARGGPR